MNRIPLHRQIFNIARGLRKGATLLGNNVFEGELDGDYIAPKVLCDTFCIELLLKCLQIIELDNVFNKDDLDKLGIKIHGHSYSEIFNNIKTDTKVQIVETYKELTNTQINTEDFENLLKKLGDKNFIEWRYVYESLTNKKIDYVLQNHILDTLGLTIQKKYKLKK